MHLKKMPAELYEMSIPFDEVYQIINENDVPIGLVYISFYDRESPERKIYIEWLEILTVFRGRGYLRKLFHELRVLFKERLYFECSEDLLFKYLKIGCEEHGINELTENYRMTF